MNNEPRREKGSCPQFLLEGESQECSIGIEQDTVKVVSLITSKIQNSEEAGNG